MHAHNISICKKFESIIDDTVGDFDDDDEDNDEEETDGEEEDIGSDSNRGVI